MIPHIQIPDENDLQYNHRQKARHIYNELFIFYCNLLQESRVDKIYQSVKKGLMRQLLHLERLYDDKIDSAQQYIKVSFYELYRNINKTVDIINQKPTIVDQYVYEYNKQLLSWEWE